MTKQQAVDIISKCAKLYDKYLAGKQVVFVYRDENNHVRYTEVLFRTYNFLHFTGVNPRSGLNANDFYRRARGSQLSVNDFSFKSNHTTELKLQILDVIMHIDTRARMIGDYVGSNLELYTEKVAGTTTACLGLIKKNGVYMPNSVLKEDIRAITPKPSGKIFAILKKDIRAAQYNQLTYQSKGSHIMAKCLPEELIPRIDLSLLQFNIDEEVMNSGTEQI